MPQIPGESGFDHSLALLREGYDFIPARCRRYGSPVFQTRLLLQKTICISGADAAALFYDRNLFTREHAAPRMLQQTLIGRGGVQTLDGPAHAARKRMLLSLMTPERTDEIARLFADRWLAALDRWQRQQGVVLAAEAQRLLARAVCAWAGVPLAEAEAERRTADLVAMFDDAGAAGPRHLRARLARKRGERWAGALIERVRAGQLAVEPGRALAVIAGHRGADGRLLDTRTAAVELLNVLRPTVAVERFITFAALELHRHPEYRRRLQEDDELVEPFVQEVRRLYSFFPFQAARVRREFEWRGYHFPAGTRVLLDLYGTDRDAAVWEAPDEFRPERFRDWDGSAFNFIPQGGGSHERGHRCPGEWNTIALLATAVRLLTRAMDYRVPEQDLGVDRGRMPFRLRSGFVMTDVRATGAGEETARLAQ